MAKTEVATFAGGCFWCSEAIFEHLKGVKKVTSGYSGGDSDNPSYWDLHRGKDTHAEAVQVEFEPSEISYEQLLLVFFKTHDPTSLNRQGVDVGMEYRSVAFYHTEDQKKKIGNVIKKLKKEKVYKNKIVTEVVMFKKFFPAEDYHQNFYKRKANPMYCQIVIDPKLEKLEKEFAELVQK